MLDLVERASIDEVTAGYRMTELGLLPVQWRVECVGKLVDIVCGQHLSPDEQSDSGIPYITGPADFSEVIARPSRHAKVAKATCLPGDILLTVKGAGVGKLNLAPLSRAAISRQIYALRPHTDVVDQQYLAHALSLKTADLRASITVTTVPGIGRGDVERVRIALPPLPEQRAIAHVLSTLQRAREATEAVIAATRELKRSLMRHLFTYGPVPVDEVDGVRLKETESGLVPENWEVRSLGNVATVQSGLTKGRNLAGRKTERLPYLRVANVQDGYLDLSVIKDIEVPVDEIARFTLFPGDVLMTEGGDFDKLGRGFLWNGEVPRCVHQNHIFAVRADVRSVSPSYLAYFIQSHLGKAYFLQVAQRTTHLASINSTKLKALPVSLPSAADQTQMVTILGAVDAKLRVEQNRSAALDSLFRTLLHGLITGRARIPVYANTLSG